MTSLLIKNKQKTIKISEIEKIMDQIWFHAFRFLYSYLFVIFQFMTIRFKCVRLPVMLWYVHKPIHGRSIATVCSSNNNSDENELNV